MSAPTKQQVYNLIKAALTGRTAGTKVQVSAHEAAELALLDYAEAQGGVGSDETRTGHVNALPGQSNYLTWNLAFATTNYDFAINGWSSTGQPLLIVLVSKTTTRIEFTVAEAGVVTGVAQPFVTND